MTQAERDPNGIASGKPGAKLDAGKEPVTRGVLQYFPRALLAVARLSQVGAAKYSWKGWEAVPDGINRYGDALGRHILKEEIEGLWDDGLGGSNELHATAVAWNALARLELVIQSLEKEPFRVAKQAPVVPYCIDCATSLDNPFGLTCRRHQT